MWIGSAQSGPLGSVILHPRRLWANYVCSSYLRKGLNASLSSFSEHCVRLSSFEGHVLWDVQSSWTVPHWRLPLLDGLSFWDGLFSLIVNPHGWSIWKFVFMKVFFLVGGMCSWSVSSPNGIVLVGVLITSHSYHTIISFSVGTPNFPSPPRWPLLPLEREIKLQWLQCQGTNV